MTSVKEKLTEAQAQECRERYVAGGTSYRKLASEFGVGDRAMYKIVNGVTWKRV